MRRIFAVLAVMAVMAAMLVVSAMPAFAQNNGEGPGICEPPGTVISEFAKQPGSVPEAVETGPPGQAVKNLCAPGQRGDVPS